MLIARTTCSLPAALGESPPRRSLGKQTCEPQRKRTRFGLVTLMVVTNLPEWVKSDTRVEVTSTCTRGTARGGWGRRVWKERPRNLGEPTEKAPKGATGFWRIHNRRPRLRSEVGHAHSSEEAANPRGAKGRDCECACKKEGSAACLYRPLRESQSIRAIRKDSSRRRVCR